MMVIQFIWESHLGFTLSEKEKTKLMAEISLHLEGRSGLGRRRTLQSMLPTEEPEFEESLSEEVTNRIQELDSELNSIELLVSEIERDMAGFEPLGGIEMEDEEDESSFAEETSVAA